MKRIFLHNIYITKYTNMCKECKFNFDVFLNIYFYIQPFYKWRPTAQQYINVVNYGKTMLIKCNYKINQIFFFNFYGNICILKM